MRNCTASWRPVSALSLALLGCSESTDTTDSSAESAAVRGTSYASDDRVSNALNSAVRLPNEGLPLLDPEVDATVVIGSSSQRDVPMLSPDSSSTVSIPFTAINGNVVAAGIRFGGSGPIRTVMLPSAERSRSGTLAFALQLPDSICSGLESTCHSVRCHQFAITDSGQVSADGVTELALFCGSGSDESSGSGDCSAASCAGGSASPACRVECSTRSDCPSGQACNFGACIEASNPADIFEPSRESTECDGLACANGSSACTELGYCDGLSQCGDGSDEAGCDTECSEGVVDCGGRLPSWLRCRDVPRCDGVADCQNGADESECGLCSSGHWCASLSSCLPAYQVCDGIAQCADDECDCEGAVYCGDGTCLGPAARCNGETECADGSDESECSTASCDEASFACRNGQCVASSWRCDAYDDCGDASDEAGCSCDGFAILSRSCAGGGCHGAGTSFSDFAASEEAALQSVGVSGTSPCEDRDPLFNPSEPDYSLVIQKIRGTAGCGATMPLGSSLPEDEIACLIDWISNLPQP